MEAGLEVDLKDSVAFIFLSRQNVCDKVVPAEEPAVPKDSISCLGQGKCLKEVNLT